MPIYGWIVGKYGGLFKEMPQKTSTYHADILAYHVAVNYDPDNHRLNMHVRSGERLCQRAAAEGDSTACGGLYETLDGQAEHRMEAIRCLLEQMQPLPSGG